ncbi:uncharacterized protein LOC128092857 [Culex pipiens pallens]|uniref:uncharacterized protein LOC128092857 n=1 Tax=Culex pipiens pallens TaxID=42434 RepID=UPI0022AB3DCB|nr:uncharacterized protein LOC128092857 [Culex pipiens pallens]
MKCSPITLLALASILALSTATSEEPNWAEVSSVCHKLLRISPEAGARRGQDQFSPDPKAACITRCIGIITGMYDDETGISMEQLRAWWVDQDTVADYQEVKRHYLECAGTIVPDQYGDDYCKKTSKHYECFMKSGMRGA